MLAAEEDGTNTGLVSGDAALFALSSTKRRELLAALARSPLSVTALQKLLGYAMSDISRHLGELRASGLVVSERHKKECIQRLARNLRIDFSADSIFIEVENADPFRRVVLKHELNSAALQAIASAA
jgi:DNA-binding transcriptional ArsR family regulator